MTTYTAAELRELDAKCAESVMGWKWYRVTDLPAEAQIVTLRAMPPQDATWFELNQADLADAQRVVGSVPRYTTDPAAFMVLLNHLRSDPAIEVDFTTAADYSRCTIRPSDNAKLVKHWASSGKGMGGNAPNIMIALTLAALAACARRINENESPICELAGVEGDGDGLPQKDA